MSNFRFIHTGDWHVGRVFARLPEEVAATLRHARTTIPDRVAEAARAYGAGHVLVAGDTFDSNDLPDREFNALMARLAANSDLTWHFIPGNHDPLGEGAIWQRFSHEDLPSCIKRYAENAPVEVADQVWLLPCMASVGNGDPTAWLSEAATPAGALRVALAHGATAEFGAGETEAIDPGRVVSAGLHYLALGDWHGTRKIAPSVWYAGTPEPEQFKTNAAGNVLAVDVAGGASRVEAEVQTIATTRHAWLARQVNTAPQQALDAIDEELAALGPRAPDAIVRIELDGYVQAEELAALNARKVKLEARVRWLAWNDDALRVALDPAAAIEALPVPALADVAARLAARASDEGRDGLIAARALRLLFAHAEAVRQPGQSSEG